MMANDITLDTISTNFHSLNGALGQKLWFSYGVLIAVYIGTGSNTVWVTPTKHSVTTSKHLNTVKVWADRNGYTVRMADTEDELNGWAA